MEVELPYKLYERPRAEGPVFAAGQDEELARWNVGGTGDPNFISNQPSYHPGTRVVVDAKLVGGRLPQRGSSGMSQARLLAQARSKGYWPIRICFEDALRRDAKQHGETRIRARVAPSSKVINTRLIESELDGDASKCLRQVLTDLRFAPGLPRGSITVDFSIKLWPGDAPVPVNQAPAGVTVNNPGLLDRTAARQALLDAIDSLKRCYRVGLNKDAKLWGRVQLLIEIDDKEQLIRVGENESRFPDPAVTHCLVEAVRQLKLPAVRGGALSYNQGIRLGQRPIPEPTPLEQAKAPPEKPAEPPGASTGSD